jgi:hypothetical protein
MDNFLNGEGASSFLSNSMAAATPSDISKRISSYYTSSPSSTSEVSHGPDLQSIARTLLSTEASNLPPSITNAVFNITQAATDVATVSGIVHCYTVIMI